MKTFTADDVAFVAELKLAVGEQYVYTDEADMQPFLEDWRGYKTGEAVAIVLPSTAGEVSRVLQITERFKRKLVPQGGNTGLCQGAIPSSDNQGIVLGLRRMNKIREIDKLSNIITVDAGVTLSTAHEAAATVNRRIPINLGSEGTAQLGGLASTNAGGTSALTYGPIRELICGIEVVLPNGAIFNDLKALRKNNTGYDLRNLFIGAEGTLGIITAVSLRMQPVLRSSAHAWLVLRDLPAAAEVLCALQDRFDSILQTAELLSGTQVGLVIQHIPRTRLPVQDLPEWSLLIELGSADPATDLKSTLEDWLVSQFEEGTIIDGIIAQNEAQAEDIWHVRHSVSEANKIHGHSLSHDIVVRPTMVPELIRLAGISIREIYPEATVLIVSHIGDGNVHYIVHFTHEEWSSIDDPETTTMCVMAIVHDIVDQLNGAFSAEHGIGRKLISELELRADPIKLSLMRQIKNTLDPENRLSPDNMFKKQVI